MPAPDFEAMLSGIAASEEEVLADLRAELAAQGSRIANTSAFSPFFRLLGAIFAGPVLYLRALVLDSLLPGIFAQQASGAMLDLRAADLDEVRKGASKAAGLITFYRAGTVGDLPIAPGTPVESPPIDGVVYRLSTTAAGTILDGSASAQVAVQAEAAGAAWNLGDGYYSILPDPVPGITAVANEAGWLAAPGRDVESDADLRTRLRLKWQRLSGWHTEDTYRSLISDVAGIDPGDVYFDLAIPRGPGSADAYILTDSGIPDAALVALANAHINDEGNHGLGDDLLVKAMPALPLDLAVTIAADGNATAADKAQLAADVENLLRAAFRESAAYPGVPRVAPFERVSRSALAGQIHAAFAAVEAVDWTAPAADAEPGMALPTINSLLVTVL